MEFLVGAVHDVVTEATLNIQRSQNRNKSAYKSTADSKVFVFTSLKLIMTSIYFREDE